MPTENKGFFRTLFGLPKKQEQRTVAPDMTTSPPTWEEFSTAGVSIDEALGIPEVGASVRIISTAVSQLDMTVERSGVEIQSPLVARPDSNRSQSSFFKRTVHDLITTGNAYWRIYRNGDGAAVQVEALSPSAVLIRHDDKGRKFFEYNSVKGMETLSNNLPTTNGGQVEHIRLGEFDGHVEGRGPIQVHNEALAAIRNQNAYYENFLNDAKRPSGIYSFEDHLDADEQAHALGVIKDKNGTGQPIVLGKGVKYSTVMFTAEEAALVEMQDKAVLRIARMFGVPAHLLLANVEGNSMTYQNLQTADLVFVRYTLEQYLTAIEDAMTNVLPRGQVAQFNVDNWLRAAAILATPAAPTNLTKETAPAA